MAKHKKQHFVPACYLKAWKDPDCRIDHKPYVWVFDKDGSNVRNKAPENIFHETDMYTISLPDGKRNLVLESGLQQLETHFARIRQLRFRQGQPLNEEEHVLLCAFIAAAHARTPSNRAHQKEQWARPLEMMEELNERMRSATDEQKARMAAMTPPRASSGPSMTLDQIRELHATPIQKLLFPTIKALTPLLSKLDFAVFETTDDVGFITSDNPCVWFDSEAYKRPPLYRAPALMYSSIEIVMPISPMHCVLLNRQNINGYINAGSTEVAEINRRIRFGAEEYFVVRKNWKSDYWFDPVVEREDAWERVQEGEANHGGS